MVSGKFIILGKNGQLGKQFCNYLHDNNLSYKAYGRDDIDVADGSKLVDLISKSEADIVINCTAYNKVDQAEDDAKTALSREFKDWMEAKGSKIRELPFRWGYAAILRKDLLATEDITATDTAQVNLG